MALQLAHCAGKTKSSSGRQSMLLDHAAAMKRLAGGLHCNERIVEHAFGLHGVAGSDDRIA